MLFEACASNQSASRITCLGYVLGVADTLGATGNACIPPGITEDQTKDLVIKYLRDHPESRHLGAASQIGISLMATFPCKK
jgi:hypothetical protein